jgi:diaminohydroxyphosphoribosylaminopyrimidine deaminase / 5-amino-6-(5-phosphoribosylamino)uracil reductase
MTAHGDRELMARALALAERGLYTTTPNPRVGCVIARDGHVLGEGWHERAGEAHAEVRALQDARARGNEPRGASAYVTLEPCNHHARTPPCVDALLSAGITRVVAAMADPYTPAGGGAERMRAAGVAVDVGLLENEARELNCGWIKRVQTGRPWVRVKIAASLDGRTALQSGASQWITGAPARADGQRWRARACAILTGMGTVQHDDPQLTVRDVETPRQPLKVIVDRHGELPTTARVLAGGEVLVITATAPRTKWPTHVTTLALPDRDGRIDLAAMLAVLGEREINELHVEAGSKLNGALLSAGLVDELLVYIAPCFLGDPARGMFELPEAVTTLGERFRIQMRSFERVGEDWRILARIEPGRH